MTVDRLTESISSLGDDGYMATVLVRRSLFVLVFECLHLYEKTTIKIA